MKFRLKKDIVIKAGTILNCVDRETRKFGEGNYACLIGLTPNTTGEFVYSIDAGFLTDELADWFEEVKNIWTCKIGETNSQLNKGADALMREAIRKAYIKLAGEEPKFIFSGWGGSIDKIERQVVFEEVKE